MRALTVQQPWAWAIIHGGKDVENRTTAWSYRGPLAIHAGNRVSRRGWEAPQVMAAIANSGLGQWQLPGLVAGRIIGVVDLDGVHTAEPACCDSPWAEQSYAEHGGTTRRDVVHLELSNPRPLDTPIPAKGALGLWTPNPDVLTQLEEL